MHLLCVCMSACVCVGGYTWMAPQMAATVLCSSVCVQFLLVFPVYLFTFTFIHLADAFIQSDLQCIQAIHLYCQYVCSLGIEPRAFALLTQCSNHWATGTPAIEHCFSNTISFSRDELLNIWQKTPQYFYFNGFTGYCSRRNCSAV